MNGIPGDDERRSAQDPWTADESRIRDRLEGALRDVVRRTLSQGQGARSQTEEVIRHLVGELRLPREVVAHLLQQADNVKTELVRVVAREVREFLESANLGEEIAKILTSLSFEIRTEVRLVPNQDAIRPMVNSRVRVKSADSEEVISEGPGLPDVDAAIGSTVSNIVTRLLRRRRGQEAHEEDEPQGQTRKPRKPRARTKSSASAKSAGRKPRASTRARTEAPERKPPSKA